MIYLYWGTEGYFLSMYVSEASHLQQQILFCCDLWPLSECEEQRLHWRVENKALSPPDTHTYTLQISTERTDITDFTAGHLKARRQRKVSCVKDGGSKRGAKTSACHWCDERTLWGWMSFICAKPSWQPRTWIRKYSETAAAPVSYKNHESWSKISPVCGPISSDKCFITAARRRRM